MKPLDRFALIDLDNWKNNKNRKPLVIRGARQVGKSFLVKMFAEKTNLDLFEVNLELQEDFLGCFASKDPKQIVTLLELKTSRKITPGKTLLFLDEFQSAPDILSTLRYFHELMPELHIIVASSLLEFILEKHSFSMPVGRIEYLHLGPMTFKEFLYAINKKQLAIYLGEYQVGADFPNVIHNELMSLFRIYCTVGGMPESVRVYRESESMLDVESIKQSILLTYRDDFSNYGKQVNYSRIQNIYQKIPLLVGDKLKYVSLDRNLRSSDLRKALHLLALAKVYTPVFHSDSDGLPLCAGVNEKVQKPLFLDVGLLVAASGMNYTDIVSSDDFALVKSGAVCEQFIGQHLLYNKPAYKQPELVYWCRQKAQASSEVDYVQTHGTAIFPVEVKAGKPATLKSLQVFISQKKSPYGVRFNAELPSVCVVKYTLPNVPGEYNLLSLPLYMVEELHRILDKDLFVSEVS